MTAPTMEEVARGLRSAAKSTQVSLAFDAMADYVLGLILDEREANARVCDDLAAEYVREASACRGNGGWSAGEKFRVAARAIRSRGAS